MDSDQNELNRFSLEGTGPFEPSQDAWEAGLLVLNALYFLRGLCPAVKPDHKAASKLITEYCRRLRQTSDLIDLARVVRTQRLSNEGAIVVLGAIATCFEVGAHRRFRDPIILAVGFHPRRLAALYATIETGAGIGALVTFRDEAYHPTPRLMELITTLSPPDWDVMRRQIRSLPTSIRDS